MNFKPTLLKNYLLWYGVITLGILFLNAYSYYDIIQCAEWHKLNDSPNFCGVVNLLFTIPSLALLIVMTVFTVTRLVLVKKGKVFSESKFWIRIILWSIVLTLVLFVFGAFLGGYASLLGKII